MASIRNVGALGLSLTLGVLLMACGSAGDPQGRDPLPTPASEVEPEVAQTCPDPPPIPSEYGACSAYPSCTGLSNVSTTGSQCVNFVYELSGGKCQWVSLGTYGMVYAYGARQPGELCDPCPCGTTNLL